MNMKKIMAGIVASALAVSTMAVAANAALATKTGNDEGAVICSVNFEGLTEEQINSITKIEAKVTATSDFMNGCIGYNAAGAGWTAVNQDLGGNDTAPCSGTWVAEFEAGALAATDDDGALAPFSEIQLWWVNPVYDEDGNEVEAGVGTVESITFYDASGNVVAPAAAGGNPPAPGETAGPGADPNKGTPDTGVEGVAVVAGLAIIAAGAVVVAKKRG